MSTLDRYIFMHWLKAFVIAGAVMHGLLMMMDMYDNFPEMLEMGAGAPEVLHYYRNLAPSFLPIVVPMALLLSLLFSLGQLHRNNEIIAMRATGLSLPRIIRGLFGAGTLLMGAMFMLNAEWVPHSVERARLIRENIEYGYAIKQQKDGSEIGVIHDLTYYNHRDSRLWFMNRFSQYSQEGFGITVHRLGLNDREEARIVASEGYYEQDEGHWVFLRGREITFDIKTGVPVHSLPFDRKAFPFLKDPPKLMRLLEKEPGDLSFLEISSILAQLPPKEDPRAEAYRVRYHSILANPLSCLIIVGLAAPFAVSGVRTNPMVGVSKAIGWFMLYYIFSAVSATLGERQFLPAFTAAWMPNALMFGVALWYFVRAK